MFPSKAGPKPAFLFSTAVSSPEKHILREQPCFLHLQPRCFPCLLYINNRAFHESSHRPGRKKRFLINFYGYELIIFHFFFELFFPPADISLGKIFPIF